jgi:hypothetical protein
MKIWNCLKTCNQNCSGFTNSCPVYWRWELKHSKQTNLLCTYLSSWSNNIACNMACFTSLAKPCEKCVELMNSSRLYYFVWLIPRRLNFMCRRFGNSVPFSHDLWRRIGVPIRRHIKFKRCGITQKKEYYIHNKAKIWNQTQFCYILTVIPTANLVAAYSTCMCHSKSLTYTLAKVRSVAQLYF